MKEAASQLDRSFAALGPLSASVRPPKGWVRAIRDALGMTTAQLARRLDVSQPRIVELEKSEVSGGVALKTLQRAAQALGCRLVYVLVPERPLAETLRERAETIADRRATGVRHTMSLEGQSAHGAAAEMRLRQKLIDELLRRPARLWDDA